VDLRQATSFVTLAWQKSPRWSLQLGLGVIWDGSARPEGGASGDVGTGGGLSLGASWLGVYETERRPFVQLTGSLSLSTTTAVADDGERHRLSAGDLRVGALAGKTFLGRVTVFAVARAFGGPVLWHLGGDGVLGGDRYHVSVGAGAIVRLPGRLDVFVEGMPLGEQSATLGAGATF